MMTADSDPATESTEISSAQLISQQQFEKRHPIQVVAQRSGLTADVIRVWERRYHAVHPSRSSANQRLYSDDDIDKLRLLRLATDAGRRISAVVGLDKDELDKLIQEDQAHNGTTQGSATAEPTNRPPASSEQLLGECMEAILLMDPRQLDLCLARAMRALGTIQFLNGIVSPLLNRIGQGWREGSVRTCQEHMATALIRSFLGQMVIHANIDEKGPRLVVCTPAKQVHELGALMSALIAATGGWNVVYLGPNIPAEEIAYAAELAQAQAVALGINYPADDAFLPQELQNLRRQLAPSVTIIAGGTAARSYADALNSIGADRFENLQQFSQYLDKLRS